MRQSKIQYNPALTVKENAKRNGVSEAAIRYYIKVNYIDRNFERKQNIIEDCRKYLKKHPKATRTELQQKTGHSLSTIRMFWEYISTGKELTNFDGEKAKMRQEKVAENLSKIPLSQIHEYINDKTSKKIISKSNSEELWSDVIKDIPAMILTAEQDDVRKFRNFLLEKPEMPMLFIGSGGMNGSFAALLYGMNAGIGKAITPLQFASLSEKAIKNSRIFLMSKGGKNDDIVYATRRAVEINPENTACFTNWLGDGNKKNRMVPLCEKAGAQVFCFLHPEIRDGFTSLRGKFYKYALLYRAFTGINTLSDKLKIDFENQPCYRYELNDLPDKPIQLGRIQHFVVLYGSYGEPVALDFESVMAESGVSSVQPVDYRNFCHGRFIFPSNHTQNDKEPRYASDVAVVMLISPREKSIASQVREIAVAPNTPVITITTEYDSPLATIDLLVKSNFLISNICEEGHGTNPYSPQNYSGVDKRFPINGMSFISDLLSYGNLTYKEPDFSTRDKLKEEIESVIMNEKANTDAIEQTKSFYPRPTRADLFKKEIETYDAGRYLCYAFRRKDDLHKNFHMPLGNMNGGFPFKMNGISFYTSESAYICGLFSNNDKKHIEIQKELIEETNGYAAKKQIRAKYIEFKRDDWEEFNVDWMLYCVWNKIKNNKEFRDILLSIPKQACIIENSTFQQVREPDTSSYWGCRNDALKEFGRNVKTYSTYLTTKPSEKKQIEVEYLNDCCNFGKYVGHNTMGKIFMILKDCLQNGTEPVIDYDLLKRKQIHLLGKLLSFSKLI